MSVAISPISPATESVDLTSINTIRTQVLLQSVWRSSRRNSTSDR